MAFENSKQHSYWGLGALATYLGTAIGGSFGWFMGKLIAYVFNYAARYGVYYVNVGLTKIETNMDKNTWVKVSNTSWELKDKIDAGKVNVSDAEIKKHSSAFRSAFRRHAMYSRVSDSQAK